MAVQLLLCDLANSLTSHSGVIYFPEIHRCEGIIIGLLAYILLAVNVFQEDFAKTNSLHLILFLTRHYL